MALAAGTPHVLLDRPCTRGDGITVLENGELGRLCSLGEEAAKAGRFRKFVPASGLATRMFQALLKVKNAANDTAVAVEDLRDFPEFSVVREFMARLECFAFYPELETALQRQGKDLTLLRGTGRFREVLECLLDVEGLGYSDCPKGLIPFHHRGDEFRTPLAEHLVEAQAYVQDGFGTTRVHFTVSPDHRAVIERHVGQMRSLYEGYGAHLDVTLSEQRADSDTLTATLDNQPFRASDGRLLLRAGGHGSLLANLNELKADIVFIQNIDNIALDSRAAIRCRKALGGYLVELQARVFEYLDRLHPGATTSFLDEACHFVRTVLSVALSEDVTHRPARIRFLREALDRPLRVCGMVPVAGESGGGPFWVRGADGACSLQIVESSQVDLEEPHQRETFAVSTHFNPVDMACGVRDRSGVCFDLTGFGDTRGAIVSIKSNGEGRFKALEHPGLWNGGMAQWNTVFVELPPETFTPVKTVLDLLRPEHQAP